VITALLTGGIVYKWQTDPLFVKKLEEWGVLSMIESVRGKAEASLPSFRSVNVPKEKEAPVREVQAVESTRVGSEAALEPEVVKVEAEPIPLPEDPVPIEIVPAEEAVTEQVEVPTESAPVPSELSIVVVPLDIEVEISGEAEPTQGAISDSIVIVTPEEANIAYSDAAEVIPSEIVEVFSEKPTNSSTVDVQEFLKEQAAQVEALKEKLQQILSEQHQELDHKVST
jgi:hypothetical protein